MVPNSVGTRWNFPWSSYPHGVWFWIGSAPNDKISSFYNHRGWISDFAKNCPADNNLTGPGRRLSSPSSRVKLILVG